MCPVIGWSECTDDIACPCRLRTGATQRVERIHIGATVIHGLPAHTRFTVHFALKEIRNEPGWDLGGCLFLS